MEKEGVCTIITGNYGHFILALHDSITEFGSEKSLAVLISSGDLSEKVRTEIEKRKNIILFFPNDLEDQELVCGLKEKYFTANHNAYRWGMKPIFLMHLLKNNFKNVIYVDCDIHFFNDYNFIFQELKDFSLLLSPHWRSSSPEKDLSNFKLNFLDGIYNGGFVGATRKAIGALKYWAELCLFNCEVNRKEGFYVDQRYLDILPTRFEGVKHLTHKGCNVASWNQIDCRRTIDENGNVLINDKYPIVFIHFTNSMFHGILLGKDKLILPYLEKYRDTLLKYWEVDIIEDFYQKGKFKNSRTGEDFNLQPLELSRKILLRSSKLLKKIKKSLHEYRFSFAL